MKNHANFSSIFLPWFGTALKRKLLQCLLIKVVFLFILYYNCESILIGQGNKVCKVKILYEFTQSWAEMIDTIRAVFREMNLL